MDESTESFVADPENSTGDVLDHAWRTADPQPKESLVTGTGEDADDRWRVFFPPDSAAALVQRVLPETVGFEKHVWVEDGTLVGVTTDGAGAFVDRNRFREVERDGRRYVLLAYTALRYRPFYDLLVPVTEDLVVGKLHVGRFPYGVALTPFGMTREPGPSRRRTASEPVARDRTEA